MTAQEFVLAASSIRGNFMAKAAVEAALLDYQLRCTRLSLAGSLGATQTRVASGVSVGIQPDIDTLLGQSDRVRLAVLRDRLETRARAAGVGRPKPNVASISWAASPCERQRTMRYDRSRDRHRVSPRPCPARLW